LINNLELQIHYVAIRFMPADHAIGPTARVHREREGDEDGIDKVMEEGNGELE